MTPTAVDSYFMVVRNDQLRPGDVVLEPLACGYVTAPPTAADAYGEHVFITLDGGQPYPDTAEGEIRIYRPSIAETPAPCLCAAAGLGQLHDATCPRLHELIETAALLWPDLGRD
ncbi:hypothetical protein [Streptosporangium sp. CA-115845]|uniref:hypothetical protein n=1 Tax=Streptosporangium sp. CA-115845 TaxID=3240071 RepID=UPI003D8E29F7